MNHWQYDQINHVPRLPPSFCQDLNAIHPWFTQYHIKRGPYTWSPSMQLNLDGPGPFLEICIV